MNSPDNDEAGAFRALVRVLARAVAEELKSGAAAPAAPGDAYEPIDALAKFYSVSGQHLTRKCRTGVVKNALRVGRTWRATRADVLAALQAGEPAKIDRRDHVARLLRAGGGR